LPRLKSDEDEILGISIPLQSDVLNEYMKHSAHYMEDTILEARKRVHQHFGISETSDQVLVMYKTLLYACDSLVHLQASYKELEREMKELRQKK
jgi:hypothetical protein